MSAHYTTTVDDYYYYTYQQNRVREEEEILEETRREAEAARMHEENARAIAEAQRAANESLRREVSEAHEAAREAQRAVYENQRKNNERFRQLQQEQDRLRKESDRKIANLRQETYEKCKKLNLRIDEIERDLKTAKAELRAELKQESKRLKNEMVLMEAKLQKDINQQRIELSNRIIAAENALHKEVEAAREEANKKIGSVQTGIKSKEDSQIKVANDFIKAAEAGLASLKAMNANFYIPNIIEAESAKLEQCKAFVNPTTATSAIAIAVGVIQDINRDISNVTMRQIEWSRVNAKLLENVASAGARITSLTKLYYDIDTNTGTQKIKARVNHFSKGRLKELVTKYNELVDKANERLPMCEQEAALRESETLLSDLCECTSKAKAQFMNSLLKPEIANMIDSVARSVGFSKQPEMVWEGDDDRDNLHVKYEDGTGQKIVVVIGNTDVDQNLDVDYNFFFKTNDQSEYDAKIKAFNDRLAQNNLRVIKQQCDESTRGKANPNTHLLDLEQTKAKKK